MTRTLVKRTKAVWDIIGLAEHIGRDDPAVAERFMDAVEQSLSFLQSFPDSGELMSVDHGSLQFVRLWQVKGFPNHLIIFRPYDDRIEVLRVCQGARDLGSLL